MGEADRPQRQAELVLAPASVVLLHRLSPAECAWRLFRRPVVATVDLPAGLPRLCRHRGGLWQRGGAVAGLPSQADPHAAIAAAGSANGRSRAPDAAQRVALGGAVRCRARAIQSTALVTLPVLRSRLSEELRA